MKYLRLHHSLRLIAFSSGLLVLASAVQVNAQPPSPAADVGQRSPRSQDGADAASADAVEGVEYLTRGPLHEAFAGPYLVDPVPGPVVNEEPPEPVDELPPEFRPSGEDIVWIPGYWDWDDEREDFIWISGVWRDLPPGQQWVPGYWHSVDSGFQHVGGFWASSEVSNVEYLPPPPESLEQGPASPAPGENHFYVPGNWVYQANDYQWQPGFWSVQQENWVWVPAQYVWTPRGCVFQAGYWDYGIAHRGVVFTPVHYSQPLYHNAGYSYRPQYTIDTSIGLFVHLFVRPDDRQYYFGDYYGDRYVDRYQPWATYYQGHRHYDPFYVHYSHQPRRASNINLISWITSQYQTIESNDRYRPARTIAAQRDFIRRNQNATIDPTVMRLTTVGESLADLARSGDSDWNLQRLGQEDVKRIRDSLAPLRRLERDRLSTETNFANFRRDARADADADAGPAKASADASTKAETSTEGATTSGDNSQQGRDRWRSEMQKRVSAEGGGQLPLPGRDAMRGIRNNDRASDRDEAARDSETNLSETARDVFNRDNSRVQSQRDAQGRRDTDAQRDARTQRDDMAQRDANSQRGTDSRGDANARRRAPGQGDRPNGLRPARPQDWPSQMPRDLLKRNLPNRPRFDGSRAQSPGSDGARERGRGNAPGKSARQNSERPNAPGARNIPDGTAGRNPSDSRGRGQGASKPSKGPAKSIDAVAPSATDTPKKASKGAGKKD